MMKGALVLIGAVDIELYSEQTRILHTGPREIEHADPFKLLAAICVAGIETTGEDVIERDAA
jgi:hypothetical protein